MDPRQQKVLDQVKALIAKATGGTTEEEAATCMRLAHVLLEKHNLQMSDIREGADEDHAVGREQLDEKYMSPWRNAIFGACLRLFFCDGFHSQWWDEANYLKARDRWQAEWDAWQLANPNEAKWTAEARWERRLLWKKQPSSSDFYRPSVVIVGRPQNRAVCVAMLPYLYNTVVRLGRDYSRALSDVDLAETGATRRKAWLDFERGCGDRVAQRILTMAYEAKLAQKRANKATGSTALTLYDQFDEENKAFMETQDLRKRRSGSAEPDSDHARQGEKAGDDVSLAIQVGADGKPRRALALPAPPKALPSR